MTQDKIVRGGLNWKVVVTPTRLITDGRSPNSSLKYQEVLIEGEQYYPLYGTYAWKYDRLPALVDVDNRSTNFETWASFQVQNWQLFRGKSLRSSFDQLSSSRYPSLVNWERILSGSYTNECRFYDIALPDQVMVMSGQHEFFDFSAHQVMPAELSVPFYIHDQTLWLRVTQRASFGLNVEKNRFMVQMMDEVTYEYLIHRFPLFEYGCHVVRYATSIDWLKRRSYGWRVAEDEWQKGEADF